MISMRNADTTDPHEAAVAAIAQAYEQLGRADEQFVFVDERVLKPEHAARNSSNMRTAVPGRRSSRRMLALLGFIGLAASAFVLALALQSPYGDAAKLLVARWAPQRASISSLTVEKHERPVQPGPTTVGEAMADAKRQNLAPAGSISPELVQLRQVVVRELADVEQRMEQLETSREQMLRTNAELAEQLKAAKAKMAHENAELLEQLKATQAQMVRDSANTTEQLKASQEQVARIMAKASEQNLRHQASAPPSRAIATPTHKPVPRVRSPQARAQVQAPMQSLPEQR